MNKTLFALLIIPFFFSCNTSVERVVKESYPDGSPKLIHYVKGKSQDLVRELAYYRHGKIEFEGEYEDGKRHGHWVYFYPDGKLWSEGYFKRGVSDGPRSTWYENGIKRYEGFYRNGLIAGKWRYYDQKGGMVKEVDYGKGVSFTSEE